MDGYNVSFVDTTHLPATPPMSPKPTILDHAAILAEASRCRVLLLLERQELTVSELMKVMQLPQSTASRHLRVLADGGWVHSRRDGTSHLYQLADDALSGAAGKLWRLIRDQMVETPACQQDLTRLDSVLLERRSRSQAFFTETASEWDRLRDELFGRRFDLQALLALLDRRWVVGDLGCGTGRTSEALAPHVDHVHAVDGSAAMLEAARRRLEQATNVTSPRRGANVTSPQRGANVTLHQRGANVTLHQSELERLPLDDGILDAAVLFLALHHTPDPSRVLAEARRVSKTGGRLLIVDMLPHDRDKYRRKMGHVWLGFSETKIRHELAGAGFADARFQPLPADPEAKGPALFVATAAATEVAGEPQIDTAVSGDHAKTHEPAYQA